MTPYYYTDENELPAGYIDHLPEMHAREVVCEWLDKVMRKQITDQTKGRFDDGDYSDEIEGQIALIKYTDNNDSYYKVMLLGHKYLIDIDALPGAGLDDKEVLKLRLVRNGRLEFVHGPHKYSHPEGEFELLRVSKDRVSCRFEKGTWRKLYVTQGPATSLFEDKDAIDDLVSLWWPWVVYHRHCVDCIKIAPTKEYQGAYAKSLKVADMLDMDYDVWYTHETTHHYKRYANGTWLSADNSKGNTAILEQLLQYALLTGWLTRMPEDEGILIYSFDTHYRHGSAQAYRQINLCHHVR